MNQIAKEKTWLHEPGLWITFFFYLLVAVFSFNRGILLGDEGYQLFFSWSLAQGKKIYKDYSLQVFPLSFLLQALLIKAFGFKLLLFKIYPLLLGIAGFFSLSYISHKITPGKYWLFSSCLYIFFSNNLFNFSLFSIDSKFFLIYSLAFLLAGFDSEKFIFWFLAGFFSAMAGFTYQTLFFLGALEFFLAWLFQVKYKKHLLDKTLIAFLIGFLTVSLVVVVYLAREHLLEEIFQVLFGYTWAKKHVWRQLLRLVFPVMFITIFSVLFLHQLWQGKRFAKILTLTFSILSIGFLIIFWSLNPQLISHSLSLLVPTALFTLTGRYLFQAEKEFKLWLCFGVSVLLFLIGLFSGYNLGYNLTASLLIIPWLGFIIASWQKKARKRFFGLTPTGIGLSLFLFSSFIYLFISRAELAGEVEPIYQSRVSLNLETAKGIYTSYEKKQELETLVNKIQELTRPEEKIWVFPIHVMIYPLSGRLPVSKNICFFYELAELKALEETVEIVLKEKALVIFQLKDGKIFQPMASEKAEKLIQKVFNSCEQKIWLNNYLLCSL